MTTMFEMAGERYGGTVIFSDAVRLAGGGVIVHSGFLSLLTGSPQLAMSELVVTPEMSSLRLLISDSGRETTPWVAPTITLTPPGGGSPIVLDASTARYDEAGRGYRMFDLPVSGATQAGVWGVRFDAASGASTSPVTSNVSVVADRSDAQCVVKVDGTAFQAGQPVSISIRPVYVHPLEGSTVSVKAAVIGPSQDGTIRRFPLTLQDDGNGKFLTTFSAPADNGVYTVQALCEASDAFTSNIETAPLTAPFQVAKVPAFRVQGSTAFIVYGGNFVCVRPNDCDGDGVLDGDEIPGDADGDGITNDHEVDADDDGATDADERGHDDDHDGIDDSVDNDMNNDGVPDLAAAGCSWRSDGGDATRAASSPCSPTTSNTTSFVLQQSSGMESGVTLDRNGTAYVVSKPLLFANPEILAVNEDGSVRWRNPVCSAGVTAPPEVLPSQNKVVVGDLLGDVNAYTTDTQGELAWTRHVDAPVNALASQGDRVFVATNGGSLYALSGVDGNVLWRFPSLLGHWGEPAVSPDGNALYVTWNTKLFAFEARSGRVLWWTLLPLGYSSAPSVSPAGKIYIGGTDYALYRYEPDGTLTWRRPLTGIVTRPPAIKGTDRLFFGASDGKVRAWLDTGTTTTQLWSRTLLDHPWSGPALAANGTLYVGTKLFGRVEGLDSNNGNLVWLATPPAGIGRSIAVGDNRLVFTTNTGRLYSY